MADKPTVLVVEDDRQWQSILREALQDEGYNVIVTDKYGYGRETVEQTDLDLVLLDLELDEAAPLLEGKRLLSLLSRHYEKIPCIVVSGKGDTQMVRDAFKRYRVADYISKQHFDMLTFVQAVRTVVRRKDREPEPARLRQILSNRFDLEEIKDLCFDLGIDFDDLPGEGKKAREVVAYCQRRERVLDLVSRIRDLRPGAFD